MVISEEAWQGADRRSIDAPHYCIRRAASRNQHISWNSDVGWDVVLAAGRRGRESLPKCGKF